MYRIVETCVLDYLFELDIKWSMGINNLCLTIGLMQSYGTSLFVHMLWSSKSTQLSLLYKGGATVGFRGMACS